MSVKKISYNDGFIRDLIPLSELEMYNASIADAEKMLAGRNGPGNDFLGWLDLPKTMTSDKITSIKSVADQIRSKADFLICIGIGGSYLGARAAIEYTSNSFDDLRKPRVLFAGHSINSDYITDLLELTKDREVAINVVSKSGTTTEPGVAFRVLRQWMESRYGRAEAAKRIIATTDPKKGALRKLATEEGYTTFDIPSDVGGRFSVLTAVGLLPLAVAGLDIAALVKGASEAMDFCTGDTYEKNLSGHYAAVRNILFRRGFTTEVLASFQPQLHFVAEWWKQLSGESEGKSNTGIFPAALDYTTDLHSMGQYMQEGIRNIFETFLVLKKTKHSVSIPKFVDDGDELNYLAGRSFEDINSNAYKGTLLAHLDGGIPAATISLDDRSETTLGQLFYFFEKAIAISGYMLRVNPFDQPGVEAYKKNMFALLGKSGFTDLGAKLSSRMKGMDL